VISTSTPPNLKSPISSDLEDSVRSPVTKTCSPAEPTTCFVYDSPTSNGTTGSVSNASPISPGFSEIFIEAKDQSPSITSRPGSHSREVSHASGTFPNCKLSTPSPKHVHSKTHPTPISSFQTHPTTPSNPAFKTGTTAQFAKPTAMYTSPHPSTVPKPFVSSFPKNPPQLIKPVEPVPKPRKANPLHSGNVMIRTDLEINTLFDTTMHSAKPPIAKSLPVSIPPQQSPQFFSKVSSPTPSTPDVVHKLTSFLGMDKEGTPVNMPLPSSPLPRILQGQAKPNLNAQPSFPSETYNRVGLHDSLSSIGLARLDAEGELGSKVYNIWGEPQVGNGFNGLFSGPFPGMPAHHRQPESEAGKSFFNFSPSGMDDFEALEPDTKDGGQGLHNNFAEVGKQQYEGAFSMFSSHTNTMPSLNDIWSNPSANMTSPQWD